MNVDDRGVIEPLLSFIDLRIHLIDSDGCDIILQNRQFKYEPTEFKQYEQYGKENKNAQNLSQETEKTVN